MKRRRNLNPRLRSRLKFKRRIRWKTLRMCFKRKLELEQGACLKTSH